MRSLAPIPIGAGLLAAVVACSDSREDPVAVGSPQFTEATTIQEFIPVASAIVNPCTGEDVQFSTELHIKTHTTIQPDGSSNFELEINSQKTQALVTGAKYAVGQEESVAIQDIPPGITFTQELSFHMIRSGEDGFVAGDDDFMVHFLFHVTVNANGTVTVFNIDIRAECV